MQNTEEGEHRKRAGHVINKLLNPFRIDIGVHTGDKNKLNAAEHRLTVML